MVRGRARDMVADDLQFMGWLLGLETDRSVDGLSNSICQFLCSRPNGQRDGVWHVFNLKCRGVKFSNKECKHDLANELCRKSYCHA
jgi:hypothetical protein